MIPITLNIAGEKLDVLFDGFKVYHNGETMRYFHAACGLNVTEEMLVAACKNKIAKN